MKYTHKYTKLDKVEYTTIRRYSKGKVGDVTLETYPGGYHKSEIKKIQRLTLDEMSIDFLRNDTDLNTRKEIYALFNKFYKKPIDVYKEKMYVYYLRRI